MSDFLADWTIQVALAFIVFASSAAATLVIRARIKARRTPPAKLWEPDLEHHFRPDRRLAKSVRSPSPWPPQ